MTRASTLFAVGSLLYQSRLVPRVLPVLGLIGAPLRIGSDVAVLLGLIGQHAPAASLAGSMAPVAAAR